jgi:hypothetical protein
MSWARLASTSEGRCHYSLHGVIAGIVDNACPDRRGIGHIYRVQKSHLASRYAVSKFGGTDGK